jgi:DNA-binding response OmpR family regulator
LQGCYDENNRRISASDNNKRIYRILIVDDDADITLTFSRALKEIKFEVDSYNDPEKALSNFKAGYYDLLLLDLRMPIMDGFMLYKRLEEIDSIVKVCFVTSYETYYNSLKKEYPSLDIGCFIHKPISMADLVEAVCIELGIPEEQ